MTLNPLFRRLVLLTAFLCMLVLTTQQSGVLQGASEELPLRDYEDVHQALQGNPLNYYLPDRPSTLSPPQSDIQQLQAVPNWTMFGFMTLRAGNPDIYVYNLSNSTENRLTAHSSTQTDPSLNFGSSTVYFASAQTGNAEIFAIDTNGQNQRPLTDYPTAESNPRISPDGHKIVFQSNRTGNSEIFVMNSDGSNIVQLTSHSLFDGYPNWSPDSSQIVYSSLSANSYDLWVMNVDGSNKRQITAGAMAIAPDWSPDGSQIAYAGDSEQSGFFELWVANADGSAPRQLRSGGNTPVDYWMPTWSPDGNWLAYTVTEWVYYQGNWYWTHSYLNWYELASRFEQRALTDDHLWEADWGHLDITPPESCQILDSGQSRWNEFVLNWESTDTQSGVKGYQVQVRLQGQNSWQTITNNNPQTGMIYKGPQVGKVELRCAACDHIGNCTNLQQASVQTIEIDAARPTSQIKVSEQFTTDPTIELTVIPADSGTGVASTDVYVKDGENGLWELLEADLTTEQLIFEGEAGHTYYFRSQASDVIGHIEPWEAKADSWVTVYTHKLSGQVTDNRGYPTVASYVAINPPLMSLPGNSPFSYQFALGQYPNHTLVFHSAGHNLLPNTTLTTTNSLTFNLALVPEDNLLMNSHFETGDMTGWNGSEFIVNTTHHTGQFGLAFTQELAETATLTQSVVLTNTLHEPTLSLWYHIPVTLENRALVISVQGITDTIQVISTTSTTSDWVHAWADVSALAGQTVTVSIKATAGVGSVYLDEIALGSWNTPHITAVTPDNWLNTEPITLAITGFNFVPTPTVFLAGLELTPTQWISSTQLQTVVPAGIPANDYYIYLQNAPAPSNIAPQPVNILTAGSFLPMIMFQATSYANQVGADWLTLGQNGHHTGENPADEGASRYTLQWSKSMNTDGYLSSDQVMVADNILIMSHFDPKGWVSGVMGVNAQTGQQLWHEGWSRIPVSIAYGEVYRSMTGMLNSYDLYTGQPRLEIPYPISQHSYHVFPPLIVGQTLYHQNDNPVFSGLYATDIVDGHTKWFISDIVGSYTRWSPTYIDTSLYLWIANNSQQASLSKLDKDTGYLIGRYGYYWRWTGYDMNSYPVISQNKVFIVSGYRIYAIDAVSRETIWEKEGDYQKTSPAVAGNSVYAINDGAVEERDTETGELIWTSTITDLVNAPVIAGNYLYIASETDTYVINRTTRHVVWQTSQGGWLTVANGYLYISGFDDNSNALTLYVYAYRAEKP